MRHVAAAQAAWAARRPPGKLPPPPCTLPYVKWSNLGHTADAAAPAAIAQPWSHARMGVVGRGGGGGGKDSAAWAAAVERQLGSEWWHVADAGAFCMRTGAPRSPSPPRPPGGGALPHWLTWAVVAVVGPGACQEGAQVLGTAAAIGSGGAAGAARQVVLGYVTSPWPSGTRGSAASAALLPPGSGGWRPLSQHPGGLAVLSCSALEECRQRGGAGGQQRKEGAAGMAVQLRNPGSSAVRAAVLLAEVPQRWRGVLC